MSKIIGVFKQRDNERNVLKEWRHAHHFSIGQRDFMHSYRSKKHKQQMILLTEANFWVFT
jgi:hypothetical protein